MIFLNIKVFDPFEKHLFQMSVSHLSISSSAKETFPLWISQVFRSLMK